MTGDTHSGKLDAEMGRKESTFIVKRVARAERLKRIGQPAGCWCV